jgi:hypothetical protein
MRKIGIIFEKKNLAKFRERGNFDLLLLPPGFSLSTAHSEVLSGVKCLSLSEFIENGEISKLSTQVAPVIRDLMSRLCSKSVEAQSSQNDLYQYHLRLQWLYVVALDRFFQRNLDIDCWIATKPYKKYDSPMRPEMGILYNNARLLSYLAVSLASSKGMTIRILDMRFLRLLHIADTVLQIARKNLFRLFLSIKLVQKILRARRRSHHLISVPDSSSRYSVGIIVRTDSEVISASYLIKSLQRDGVPYCVIHDEVISSTTTLKRLESMGIQSVSIGAMLGLTGVMRAWLTKTPLLDLDPPISNLEFSSDTEFVMIRNEEILDHLKNRLNDFFSIQVNFRIELEQIIKRYRIGLLVTYAYVDQWGGVIKAAGDLFGIKTLAIQNAAQDPEEYPQLCWSDFYCVESFYLKNKLISLGYPSEKIAATGLPQFSSFDKSLYERKHKDIYCNNLLILTQPIYHEYFENLIEFFANFSKENGFNLSIKYHPRQKGDEYNKVIVKNNQGINIRIYKDESLDELILNSTAVISVCSAALIRSINIGTPTISFLPVEERHLDLYYANNANLYCVSTLEELTALFNLMIADEPSFRSGFEERRNHYMKEHATFEPTTNTLNNIMLSLLKILNDG